MFSCLSKGVLLSLILLALAGCESGKAQANNTSAVNKSKTNKAIPVACKQFTPPVDIWKLEAMLTEKGEIKAEMSKEQKAKIIRAYIAKKNSQYQICLKGSENQ